MDLFFVDHHAYLACADRFTGWLILYHLPPGKANSASLIEICRNIFITYGVPEEISRDGGPPMQSQAFLDFLDTWKVKHRGFGHVHIVVRAGWFFAIGEASDLQGRILVATKK